MSAEGAEAIDVFVSYSHRDEELRGELEIHLATLRRQGAVRVWHDRKITPGMEWAGEIDRNLTSAHVVLLLVSPEFIASDYCWDKEMTRALERHRAGKARVVPIILRPCDWQSSPLGELQALPREARPIVRWQDRDEAFLDVVRGVRLVVNELRKPPTVPSKEAAKPAIEPPTNQEKKVLPRERTNPKDGSVLVYVPGGEYVLGAEDCGDDAKPIHRVKLNPFWIGKYAVTNEQYGRFLAANPKHEKPYRWGEERFDDPRQPVVGVSWSEAMAYCQWAGLVLPAEAQWEAAARGTDQRPYPWGQVEPTAHHAKFGDDWETGKPALVGSYPLGAGPFGTFDQAGNVWEWCRDQFQKNAYHDRDGKIDPCTQGEEHNETLWRVVRGGSWDYPSGSLRAAIRFSWRARSRNQYLGLRVAVGVRPEHGD